jgi:uncharacterized membrane protein
VSKLSTTDRWMLAVIGVALLAGLGLACQKYGCFNGETNDLTVYSYAFTQTLQGRFLPLYYQPGSLLGNHLNFIILLWLPVYFFWRSFYSLLFFQSAMLALSAWPLYRIAKRALGNERPALLLGCTFLVFPTIVSQHFNQLHDDQFALPFLLFAFDFFLRADFRKFVFFMVLACLAKETMPITTAVFGIYALFLRRSWKWVITPLLFGIAYFLLAVKLLTSVFPGAGAVLYTKTRYFEAYGRSPTEVLSTFLTKPGSVLEAMFSSGKQEYLFKLLLPVLFLLPFLSLSVIISLPNLFLNLVGTNSALTVIPWHYNIILGATLLVATAFGIRRIADRCGTWADGVRTGFSAATLALAVYGVGFWFQSSDYRAQPYVATLRRVVGRVPQTASVLCPGPMAAHFSGHPRLTLARSILNNGDLNAVGAFDYVVLDGNWRNYDALAQQPVVEWIQKTNLFELVLREQNVFVLRQRNLAKAVNP